MLFKRGQEGTQPVEKVIGFEPEDKPTPTLGKLMLLIMAGLLIFLGTQGLRDIENIPTKPEPVSSCTRTQNFSQYEYYGEYSTAKPCQFSKYEIKHGIPEIYKKYEDTYNQVNAINQKKSGLNSQMSKLNLHITDAQREYDLSLQENIANENARVGQTPDQLREKVQNLQAQKQTLQAGLSSLEIQTKTLEPSLNSANVELKAASEKARNDYDHDIAVYRFKVFLIQAVLIFPLFAFFLKLYFNLKAKDSPHTVIATTLAGVSGLFVFGITTVYLWSSFLQNILEEVFKTILSLPIARTIFYYVAMLAIIAIFGGSVYHLQKKIFDPARVQLRRLRAKKCPHCEFPFNYSKSFCPSCGKQLMEKCKSCSNLRYTIMKHCPNCGAA